jgi:hypothetical protein
MKCLCGCENDILVPAERQRGKPRLFASDQCATRYRVRKHRGTSHVTVNQVTDILLPDIQFYCGLNETAWNYHPMEPGEYFCVAPVTTATKVDPATKDLPKEQQKKIRVLRKTHILIDDTRMKHCLLDSGAFSDGIELDWQGHVVKDQRLSFNLALERQIAHAYTYHYAHLVEKIVSYDLLIDEVWLHGERSKNRWSVAAAEYAVQETVKAARYLASQRARIDRAFNHHVRLILSAQGVEPEQYKRCAQEIVKVMAPDDIFGLGGWCIAGLRRHIMLPAAGQILPGVFEILGQAGVKDVHVFGVIYPELLGFLLYLCDRYGMRLSTDSAGPCSEPAMHDGRWGYGSHTNPAYKVPPVYKSCSAVNDQGQKAPTCPPELFCRGQARILHVQETREYLAHFREQEPALYKMVLPPQVSPYEQMTWIEIGAR